MTRGTRIIITVAVETDDGDYAVMPLREGYVEGHHPDDLSRVWVQWTSGDRAGERQLLRATQAARWVWR